MPLLMHSPLLVCGIILLVLGLMLLGLWVFIDSSLWIGAPAKARAIRLDYRVHLLPSALMLLGVGVMLIALPLWLLAGVDQHNTPEPGESQVSLHPDKTEHGEEQAVTPPQEERTGQPESQGRRGRAAFDIAGEWTMINTVLDTQYVAYRHLQLGFRLWIRQQGNTFEGRGEKYLENGRPLPASARPTITIQGTLKEGTFIEATFQEAGLRRHTSGRFQLTVHGPHQLRGTFVSTVAGSRGASQWTRVRSVTPARGRAAERHGVLR